MSSSPGSTSRNGTPRIIKWGSVYETVRRLTPAEISLFKQRLVCQTSSLRTFAELYATLDREYSTQNPLAFAALMPIFCDTAPPLPHSRLQILELVELFENIVLHFSRTQLFTVYQRFGSMRATLFTGSDLNLSATETIDKGTPRYLWMSIMTHLLLATANRLTDKQISDAFFICCKVAGDAAVHFFRFLLCMHGIYGVLPPSLVDGLVRFIDIFDRDYGGRVPADHVHTCRTH